MASSPIPVLPILDTELGTVTLYVAGERYRYLAEDPHALERALANACAAPRWDRGALRLVVRTAAAGKRRGVPATFTLTEPPSSEQCGRHTRILVG
ncbi:hypothetical protein ACQ3I4_10705 [Zafaria sp. Z1313]|uniref:hypothetical protein n=1 Tax=unclassified Zafaria TaxID=2828765 RepID=UPI002E7A74C9|nr:hypothetical protein [Zafaria sp. J156]MEE1622217.1 hypothetical protein [Zafaria sp. J156]